MNAGNSCLRSDVMIVYGLGTIGQQIVDELLENGVEVDLILDRGKDGQNYRGIPVQALENCDAARLVGRKVLLGLHNHYVNVNDLAATLKAAGAACVLTPISLRDLLPSVQTRPGYWLDYTFDYDEHEDDFQRARQLLADGRSRDLFDAVVRYRKNGDLHDCPKASLHDEYTPADLPRYIGPLKLIDCGAFTGVAIHKFLKAGYQIEFAAAFEPDLVNFEALAARNFPVARSICLPLGTWSKTIQLRFANDSSMASHLSETGGVTVQCVAIDHVLRGESVNLIKLDVEGAEIETLLGAEQLIRHQRPNLLVSAYHTPGHLYEILDLVASWDLGYYFYLRVHEFNTFGIVLYCLQKELIDR